MIHQHVPVLVFHVDGSIQAAILMAISGSRLRVSMPALDDVVEFRWEDGRWKAEDGEPVAIQFDAAPDEFHRRAQASVDNAASPRDAIGPDSWRGCEEASAHLVRVN